MIREAAARRPAAADQGFCFNGVKPLGIHFTDQGYSAPVLWVLNLGWNGKGEDEDEENNKSENKKWELPIFLIPVELTFFMLTPSELQGPCPGPGMNKDFSNTVLYKIKARKTFDRNLRKAGGGYPVFFEFFSSSRVLYAFSKRFFTTVSRICKAFISTMITVFMSSQQGAADDFYQVFYHPASRIFPQLMKAANPWVNRALE